MNMLDKMMHLKNPLDLDEDLNHVLYEVNIWNLHFQPSYDL